jgi:leader peptidase (prepilin peptidase)/N-methyltransferase
VFLPIFSQIIIVIFLGLVLGSFATALIYRVPQDISWSSRKSRSFCPHCKNFLKLRDLMPVFSWLAGGGKCRHCKESIEKFYPLTEIMVVAACLGVFWSWGLTLPAAFLFLSIPFLAALLVIDLQHMILPDQLVFTLGLLALGFLGSDVFYTDMLAPYEALTEYISGGIMYAVFAWLLALGMGWALKREALGFGDVKFFAVAGLWLGLSMLGWFCVLAGITGVIISFLWKIMKKGEVFPFGPALIVSLYFLLIFQR